MKSRAAWGYFEGFGRVRSVLELDPSTAQQIMVELDPEREDPLLNPWKRGCKDAIRTARDN